MTYLDIGLIVVMGLSGLFAMARGFVREVLSIGAWLIAAFGALWLHPHFLGLAIDKISNELVAKIVVISILFIIILMIVSFITGRISDMILNSSVGFIDRILGFGFGLLRGFLIVTIAFMFFTKALFSSEKDKANMPEFISKAQSLSALQNASDKITALLPDNLYEQVEKQLDKNKLTPKK
jgi:membrane protein required for colicin V production